MITPSSSLGSFPVATATLPAREKRPRARDVRRRLWDGGDTRQGPAAWRAGACSSTGHFSIRVQIGQFRTFYNSLVLYIIVTDLKFVYFVKKTAALGGYFLPRLSFSARQPRRGHRGWLCRAGAIRSVPAGSRRGTGTPPVQLLISSLISTSGSRSWPPARDVTGRHPAGFISWGWGVLPRACPGLQMWYGGAEDAPGWASPRNGDGVSIELLVCC